MSIGFLCERYFRSVKGSTDTRNDKFIDLAAAHFNVNKTFFRIFCNIYRNGIQHQGSPKSETNLGISYRWLIDGSFPAVPAKWEKNGHVYVCINPWGFTKLCVNLFIDDHSRLGDVSKHSFGEVFECDEDPQPYVIQAAFAYP